MALPCLHDGFIMYEYTCLIQYVGQNKSITNRAQKKWECGGKKLKSGIEAEERIDVTTKTTFLPTTLHYRAFGVFPGTQNSCRRTNLNSSFRIFCSLKKVLLVYHDHYWMTKHGRGEGSILVSWSLLDDGTWEEKVMVQKKEQYLEYIRISQHIEYILYVFFMIIIGWWNMGGEGNGAKREQYLDWWNKNWLETRLSGNPPIFFICSSSGFLFAVTLTLLFICDIKHFNIHFDDLFR